MTLAHFLLLITGALLGALVTAAVCWRRISAEITGRVTAEARYEESARATSQVQQSFRALSAEALESNNEAFLRLARESLTRYQEAAQGDLTNRQSAIDHLVKPLRDTLEKVDTKLHDLELARVTAFTSVEQHLQSLAAAQKQLQGETANLVKALRAPATRGRWGEMQLRRVVEVAGMMEHCDFREQHTLTTEDGRLRPDLVIQLPGGRQIAVDAKVPLEAFLDAMEADDATVRKARLKGHAQQLRTHLQKLGSKGYWQHLDSSIELVVAFLPGDSLHQAALEHDPELFEFGVNQRVLIATPTNLIGLLKTVAFFWREQKMAANAAEISDLGREIHERLAKFVEHFGKVGENLGRAVEAYNRAAGNLETRVLVSARRIKEKGATASQEIPEIQPVDRSPRTLEVAENSSSRPYVAAVKNL